MKNSFILLDFCLALAAVSCSNESEKINTAPACQITSPSDGAMVTKPGTLVITGEIKDAEDNVVSASLSVNGKIVKENLELPSFSFTLSLDEIERGECTIALEAKDDEGLSGQSEVKIGLKDENASALLINGSSDNVEIGYDGGERTLDIDVDGDWTLSSNGIVYGQSGSNGNWGSISKVKGSGKASIPIKVEAADFFVDKTFWISVDSKYAKGTIDFVQKGSPDFLNFIEDPNLKLAASVSFSIYGIDRNEDNAISAYEVKYEYPDNQPYGIDAGSYSIKSAKGIEYFPQLKHLDLNMNPDLKELDLSGNPKLASLHLQGCTSLDNLDISKNQELIELGLNYSLFIKIKPQIDKIKSQIHTIGAFDRKEGENSVLDLSGYANLQRLYVNGNNLTEIKLTGCNLLWRLVAMDNDLTELDLSEVDRNPLNTYVFTGNPNLKTVYVWQGFKADYYDLFSYDKDHEIKFVEK